MQNNRSRIFVELSSNISPVCPTLGTRGCRLYKEVKYGQVTQGSMNFSPNFIPNGAESALGAPARAHSKQTLVNYTL